MWIFVEPLDVWLFRDGRPFMAGEQVRATGMFPPLPTTFQGAVRSAALARALDERSASFADFNNGAQTARDLRDRWGDEEAFGHFRLRGPFVARRRAEGLDVVVAAPADLLIDAQGKFRVARMSAALGPGESMRGGLDGQSSSVALISPDAADADEERAAGSAAISSGAARPAGTLRSAPWPEFLGLPDAGDGDGAAGSTEGAVGGRRADDLQPAARISMEQLRAYLLGTAGGTDARSAAAAESQENRTVVPDLRVGIERDRSKGIASHGRLYMVHFHRPGLGVGLAAEVRLDGDPTIDLGRSGLMGLGGEARAARYTVIDDNPLAPVEETRFRSQLADGLRQGTRFKLVLVTPGVFDNGWCPDFIRTSDLKGTLADVGIRLAGAAVQKPVAISGWDARSNRPKPLRLAVPAGSTYVFEVIDAGRRDWPDEVINAVHGRSAAIDGPGSQAFGRDIGMALTFVGTA